MFSWKTKNNQERKTSGLLKNPKILEVNLVKDNVLVSFDWGANLLVLALTLVIASVLVAEVYYGLSWWNDQELLKIETLQSQVDKISLEANQSKQQAAAALSYKDRSLIFTSLLDNHVHWTNFFSWLEHKTLGDVQYDGFSGDLSGTYSLTASTKNFADVSWQVNSFLKDDLVKKVTVSSAAFGKGADKTKAGVVGFSISLEVKPDIFKNKYDESKPKK